MAFFRIISQRALDRIVRDKIIETSQETWPHYRSGEIVCIYEADSHVPLFARYGEAIARNRELNPAQSLFIIQISNIDNIEVDRSQNGWVESRVHFGSIPIAKLSIVAQAEVESVRPGNFRFKELKTFDKPLAWDEQSNSFR